MDFIFDPSLVLYLPLWKRDAADGQSFMSDDAYGHLCTVTGALWTPRGRTFDGIADIITIPAHSSINNLPALTLIAWLNPTSAGEDAAGTIICKSPSIQTVLRLSASLLPVFEVDYVTTDLGMFPTTAVSLSTNQMLTVTWDGSRTAANVLMYLNEVLLTPDFTRDGVGDRVDDSASDLIIGNIPSGTRTFDGLIGEVWLYNRILNPLEIQRNYLATKWRYQ